MHIERLEIETFGGLVQVTIADLGRGVQVLHGTNEVGKTSLLEFVRAIFFGFEGLFRRGVLDPQVPCSGRLVVAIGRGPRGDREQHRFSIERRHEGRRGEASVIGGEDHQGSISNAVVIEGGKHTADGSIHGLYHASVDRMGLGGAVLAWWFRCEMIFKPLLGLAAFVFLNEWLWSHQGCVHRVEGEVGQKW